MKKELYCSNNNNNNKWIAYVMYLLFDLVFLAAASILVLLIVDGMLYKSMDYRIAIALVILILPLLYTHKKMKKYYKYQFNYVKIDSDGTMYLKGYKGFETFEIEINFNNIKFQYLTVYTTKNKSRFNIIFLNDNEKIYISRNPPEIYEVLSNNFPNSEIKETWTFHLI